MNIIYGIYTASGGDLLVNEKEVKIRSVEDAIKLRMGMVHQEFMLIPRFTVTQNIVIGDEPHKGIFFDYGRAVREVRELSEASLTDCERLGSRGRPARRRPAACRDPQSTAKGGGDPHLR